MTAIVDLKKTGALQLFRREVAAQALKSSDVAGRLRLWNILKRDWRKNGMITEAQMANWAPPRSCSADPARFKVGDKVIYLDTMGIFEMTRGAVTAVDLELIGDEAFWSYTAKLIHYDINQDQLIADDLLHAAESNEAIASAEASLPTFDVPHIFQVDVDGTKRIVAAKSVAEILRRWPCFALAGYVWIADRGTVPDWLAIPALALGEDSWLQVHGVKDMTPD